MSTFALDLKKFAAKAGAKADGVVREVVAQVVVSVDKLSPVGNPALWKHPAPKGYVGGHFRGNWQLGVGSIPAGILARIDNSGGTTVAANIAEIPGKAAGTVIYLANNLPYARRLEYDHWSSQAPNGMVGLTAVRFQSIVDEAVKEVRA